MNNKTFAFGPTVGDREDGAPAYYAQYCAEDRDGLAATDIMLALVLEKDEEKKGSEQGFDPYNSAGA
jgi:hypothetical protein